MWIPDAVRGAVTSDRTGKPDHRPVLEAQLTRHRFKGPYMARAPGPVVRQEILRLTSRTLARGGFAINCS